MTKDHLGEALEELRVEIHRLDTKDVQARARIEQFVVDLEHHVAYPDDADHRSNLVTLLSDLVAYFEAKHPRLTEVLNRVSDALSGAGI